VSENNNNSSVDEPEIPVSCSEDYILRRKAYWDAQTEFRDYAFETMRQEVRRMAPKARLIITELNDSDPPRLSVRGLLTASGEDLFDGSGDLDELQNELEIIAGDLELHDFQEVDSLLFRHECDPDRGQMYFQIEIPEQS